MSRELRYFLENLCQAKTLYRRHYRCLPGVAYSVNLRPRYSRFTNNVGGRPSVRVGWGADDLP